MTFDRDIASEPGITGARHLAHPAHADPFVHQICAEPTAGEVHAFLVGPSACATIDGVRPSSPCGEVGLVEQGLHVALQRDTSPTQASARKASTLARTACPSVFVDL